jgi:hypothetical protein
MVPARAAMRILAMKALGAVPLEPSVYRHWLVLPPNSSRVRIKRMRVQGVCLMRSGENAV